jgi:hypothetical protein
METTLIWIVASSIFFNLILIALLGVLVYRLLKQKDNPRDFDKKVDVENKLSSQNTTFKKPSSISHKVMLNENVQMMKAWYDEMQNSHIGDYCVDHPHEVSIGLCSISGQHYCQHCLKTFQNIKLGKKFLNMYLAHDWVDFMTLPKNNPYEEVPEKIVELKKKLWHEKKMPVIIQNHFKINITDDSIESYTVLQARTIDKDLLESEFSKI